MKNQNKEKSTTRKWTRRAFIGIGGLTGIGLVAGVGGYMYMKNAIKKYSGEGMGKGDSLNAWIRIAPDNTVTLAIARAEMGQGVYTALAQMIAEELEVEMSSINVIHPQPESPYTNTYLLTQGEPNVYKNISLQETLYSFLPIIVTGGSTTVVDAWHNLRYAGATAREMLIRAAANKWELKTSDCFAEKGHIFNKKNKEKFTYGQLAEAASSIEIKTLPALKKQADYKVMRKPAQRLDIPEKVNGTAVFGLDVRLEGMLYAAVKHPQTIGGKILSIENESEILAMPGVKKMLISAYGPAIVIADNTWRASMATRMMKTKEDQANVDLSSVSIKASIDRILKEEPIEVRVNNGDVAKVFASEEGKTLEARYDVPYLAHATMEPMNCTVLVKDGKCDSWVGHQSCSVAQNILSEVTGIAKDNVTVNITYLGGGFGRRSEPDFVRFAAEAANAMPGIPVQTVFTREEDMQNDMYRPMAACTFKATVKPTGEIAAWDNMLALQSVENNAISRIMPTMATAPKDDKQTVEGLSHIPYEIENHRLAFGNIDLPIQIGFWRSVGFSQNAFFRESFLDECAHTVGIDPYEFRKSKLIGKPRYLAVLDKVAQMSNWTQTADNGKFRGIALVKSFGSIVGQVVELSKNSEKEFKIEKVYCVIDCGNYVNPNIIEGQMQGGIIFGLSAALYGEITWKDGQVEQLNFPQYEMVRLNVCPRIDVHIMEIDEKPGGVGEPGTPPIAPALANAIFAASGERVRSLPLTKSGISFV